MKKMLFAAFVFLACEPQGAEVFMDDSIEASTESTNADGTEDLAEPEQQAKPFTVDDQSDKLINDVDAKEQFTTYADAEQGNFTVYGPNPTFKLCLNSSCTNEAIVLKHSTSSNKLILQAINNGSTTNLMTFLRNGSQNIGIGTTTPDHMFTVAGTIGAREIIVDANMADYVFQDGYDLWNLEEVEQHIKEKKHLPGMPSKAEVDANGVSLGDFNALLLQKIEELTLHTIAQQKEIDNMKKAIGNGTKG